MQYAIDTLNIEIARLNKTIREMKTRIPNTMQEDPTQSRLYEFENQIREMKKAIGVLKEHVKNQRNDQYASRLLDSNMR